MRIIGWLYGNNRLKYEELRNRIIGKKKKHNVLKPSVALFCEMVVSQNSRI